MAKIIENDVLQGIVNYLAKRPYDEVFQVLPKLTSLPDYIVEPKEETPGE